MIEEINAISEKKHVIQKEYMVFYYHMQTTIQSACDMSKQDRTDIYSYRKKKILMNI